MSGQNFDAIVVGVGGMGSATCCELARRGVRVLGLEQFDLGHDRGSSHGRTRVIRNAYYEHPSYVPLVRRAYECWYDLEQLTGQHLLTECGCLNVGLPAGELVQGVQRLGHGPQSGGGTPGRSRNSPAFSAVSLARGTGWRSGARSWIPIRGSLRDSADRSGPATRG